MHIIIKVNDELSKKILAITQKLGIKKTYYYEKIVEEKIEDDYKNVVLKENK